MCFAEEVFMLCKKNCVPVGDVYALVIGWVVVVVEWVVVIGGVVGSVINDGIVIVGEYVIGEAVVKDCVDDTPLRDSKVDNISEDSDFDDWSVNAFIDVGMDTETDGFDKDSGASNDDNWSEDDFENVRSDDVTDGIDEISADLVFGEWAVHISGKVDGNVVNVCAAEVL